MTASTHLAVGAAAGLVAQEFLSPNAITPEKLFWAFASGIVSHMILDAVPHQEYSIDGFRLGAMILAEAGVVFALVLSLRNSPLMNSIIFLGMVGGALSDVIELVYFYILSWNWLRVLSGIIHFAHYKRPIYSGFVLNFYLQAILAIIAVVFARFKSAKFG